jgi:cyanophycin synthetase
LGVDGIDTLEQLAAVKRVVIRAASQYAVLNADNGLSRSLAGSTAAKKVCFFTLFPNMSMIESHTSNGGIVVARHGERGASWIALHETAGTQHMLRVQEIPACFNGIAVHNVENALCAIAAAYVAGITVEDIGRAMTTFCASPDQCPGRLNMFSLGWKNVMVDYAHNAHGVKVLRRTVERIRVPGRKVCVIGACGDRRTSDIVAIGRAAAGGFDQYVCKPNELRSRHAEEINMLLRAGLLEGGVSSSAVRLATMESEAFRTVLDQLRDGDFAVLLAYNVSEALQLVQREGGRPVTRSPGV